MSFRNVVAVGLGMMLLAFLSLVLYLLNEALFLGCVGSFCR